ncbi:MAG: flagellar export protein FliJ [Treponema sp.]|nr:flagellar export protein FliJ [Treponema sp.]
MKRFNFKLEKILKLRENRERETEIELGKAVGILAAIETQIKNVAREKVLAVQYRFSGNFNQMRSYEFYIQRLDQTRDTLLEKAALAELEVERTRAIYLEASRDRKIFSKLKERQEREYRRNVSLEEIKIIDDLSGGRTAREAVVGA